MSDVTSTTAARSALTPNPSPKGRGGFKHRPRKQLLLKLGVFLLLGVVVNVAVAWGAIWKFRDGDSLEGAKECHAWSDEPLVEWSLQRSRYSYSLSTGPREVTSSSVWKNRIAVPSWSLLHSSQLVEANSFTTERGWGWPCYSLRSFVEFGSDKRIVRKLGGVLLPESKFVDMHAILPCYPLWPGFAINTIFYAALLWVLWIAPGKIRRYIRIQNHRCPACGFIIAPGTAAASGGPCSECGFGAGIRD